MNSRLFHRTKLFCAFILSILIFYGFEMLSFAIAEDRASFKSAPTEDKQVFMGRWIRPDGGYILELSESQVEGRLNAAYYNPGPINVARGEHANKEGRITIYIELRDINYPGSKYNLRYDPQTDRLVGTYFQAVRGETYHIEFLRIR